MDKQKLADAIDALRPENRGIWMDPEDELINAFDREPLVFKSLTRAFRSAKDDEEFQMVILQVLAKTGNDEAIAFVMKAFRRFEDGRRRRTIEEWASSTCGEAGWQSNLLCQVIWDETDPHRDTAAEFLGLMGPPDVFWSAILEPGVLEDVQVRHTVMRLIADGDPYPCEELVDVWLAILEHGDADERSAAADALGHLGDSRAVKPLIAILESGDDAEPRDEAAMALCRLGGRQADAAIRRALKSKDEALVAHVTDAQEYLASEG